MIFLTGSPEQAAPSHRLLPFVFGAACTVVLIAGVRSVAGLVNPVIMAGALALMFQPLLQKLRGLIGGAAIAVVVLLVVVAGLLLTAFVGGSLRQFAVELPQYEQQLRDLTNSAVRALAERGFDAAAYLQTAFSDNAVASRILDLSGTVAGGIADLVITLFVFAFMLGGMAELERRASDKASDHSRLAAQFLTFSGTMRRYMSVRTVLGLAAALLNYVLLLALGVDYALLWGVLSFVLSYVPTVGFAISMVPPTLLALLEHGWRTALLVVVGYYVINTVLDNVVGPRVIGRQVNLSPLLSFLSVLFWTWLLGPTGAILCVPLTVLVRDLALAPAASPAQSEEPGMLEVRQLSTIGK
jgi:AI-2 transport protein TqsA